MKALAIDSAVSRLTISAKNDDHFVSTIFDIGMKQSETLLPAIDYVLEKLNITTKDLDYLVLSQGPGSFTGLRLAFAALKSIEMAENIPLYGISTLDTYMHHYSNIPTTVLCCIDAKKDKFYSKAINNDNILLNEGDYTFEEIAASVKDEKELLICGSDSHKIKELFSNSFPELKCYSQDFDIITTNSLFTLAEKKIANNAEPLKDFEGPTYLRASEAEENLRVNS